VLRGVDERDSANAAPARSGTGAAPQQLRPVLVRSQPVLVRSRSALVRSRSALIRSRSALVRSRPALVRRRSATLAVGVTLLAAALGFLIASTTGVRSSPVAFSHRASAGLLEVSYPSSWRRQASTAARQLRLTDELALAPDGPGSQTLIVGRTNTTDPSLLPQTLLARLSDAPKAQTVTLGQATFYRYQNLSPRGTGLTESVYAAPTRVGTVLGLCLARNPSPSFSSSCERVFGTLKLSSGTLALGLSPSYASGLNAAINQLNGVRSRAGSQLSHAGDARLQAAAATELSTAHAGAASALLRLNAGVATAANSAAAAALRMMSQSYAAFASAAAHADVARYGTARASLTNATKALNSAFTQLRALGYRLG
jgi:hypothetical protein